MATTTSFPGEGQLPGAPEAPTAPEVQPLVTPAIQLRNTYPPGQPPLGGPPKPLGKTPTAVNQIMYPISGIEPTHFQGPLVSGITPGVQGAAGTAVLTLALQVDWSMGNFNLPIQFPGGSFITALNAVTYLAGLAATIVNLGSLQAGTDIGTVTVPPVGTVFTPVPPSAQLPLWDKATPFLMWMGVTGNTGNTAGGTIILVEYVRLASPWSPPAK